MTRLLSSNRTANPAAIGPGIDAPRWATECLNCAAPMAGRFCSHCGQRAVPPHPTTRELAGDAYSEVVGWDGKFAVTIGLLLWRPGELTRAWIEGQRARHISPVRLYLMCSVVYFVVAAAAPLPNLDMEFDVGIGVGPPSADQTAGEAALGRAITGGIATLPPAERALAEREIAVQPKILQPMLRAMAEDYPTLRRRTGEMMPRALFVLIPALAAILALFHRGRHYPEHLYFAIHFEAFVFLMLTLAALAQYGKSLVWLAIAQGITTLWIVAYGVLAQRRVYGGSWLTTAVKAIGVAALFSLLWATTVIGVTLWASRPG